MMRLSQQLFSDHKDHKISIFVEGFTPFVIVSLIALNIYSDAVTNNNKEILFVVKRFLSDLVKMDMAVIKCKNHCLLWI